MKSPTTYFIHCDLVDKEQNLLNGKPSTVLQTFDITGKPYEKVFYQSSPQHILCDISADKHITNMSEMKIMTFSTSIWNLSSFKSR